MGNKADIRICRSKNCLHKSKEINLMTDKFVKKGSAYYHEDCYEKDEIKKRDYQFIKNLWIQHISNTVVYSQLYTVLNNIVDKGVSSDYLVFVVRYCIDNHYNLNYPAGLTYYVDRKEIKDAYKRRNEKNNKIDQSAFKIKKQEDDSPKISFNKKKTGFQNIFS